MRKWLWAAGMLSGLSATAPAMAGVFADDLSRCVARAATAADRQALVRWIFLAASSNPNLRDLVRADDQDRIEGTQAAAQTFNRLLLTDCRSEAVDAIRNEGQAAIMTAFEALGQYAGREMMSSETALIELQRLDTYLDAEGMEALGREAGVPATGASGAQR